MTTLLRHAVALLVLACALPGQAAAQPDPGTVQGAARGPDGAEPLAFLLVRLLPEGGGAAPARSAVTDAEGRFRFTAVPPGEYRLHVEQIGYERTRSPVLRVRPGETLVHDIRSAARAIQLEAVTVQAGQCLAADRLRDDPELAALWDEIGKGVETRRAFERQYRYTRVMRQEIHTRWRFRSATRRVQTDTAVNEPDSVAVREARRRASAYAEAETIRLPDEKELLDPEFLRGHCLDPAFDESEGVYVIRFRPVRPQRGGVDVRGAVHVDAGTYLIRRLEFEYLAGTRVHAESWVQYGDVAVAGGTLRLPVHGHASLRPRGVGAAIAVGATSTLTLRYEGFQPVGPE